MSCVARSACDGGVLPDVAGPFPFREPISSASAVALIFQHVSAAIWADPIDDRRDNVVECFCWHGICNAHSCLWIEQPFSELLLVNSAARCSPGLRMSVNCAAGIFHSQAVRAGWLRNSSGRLLPRS